MEAKMYDSKPKKRGHKCTKRKHGNPKIGAGVCHGHGQVRDAVKDRIVGKKLEKAWLEVKDPNDSDL